MMMWVSLLVIVVGLAVMAPPILLRKEFPVNDGRECAVVITGVSSGIGLDAAKSLADDFAVVYGTVRKEADAKQFAGIKNVVPMICDVTNADQVDQLVQDVTKDMAKRKVKLCGLVNNAGISGSQIVEGLEMDVVRKMFEVNYFGVLMLTQKFLPLIREAQGRIVNVGSLAGFIVRPFSGAYSSTKFALNALTDALRRELEGAKVSVSLVEPGVVASQMQANAFNVMDSVDNDLKAKGLYEIYAPLSNAKRASTQKSYSTQSCPTPADSTTPAIKHALQDKYPETHYQVAGFGSLSAKGVKALAYTLPTRALDLFFNPEYQ